MSAINWFDIPVTDIKRAVKFYSTILGAEVQMMDAGEDVSMAMLPMEGEGVGGALTQTEGYKPSKDGTVVYLNGGADLSAALNRVEKAGGKVIVPKTDIGEHGFFAIFEDSEGNHVGLHSMG